jgi:hypothetical protein
MIVVIAALSAIVLMVGAVVLVNHVADTKLFLWVGLLLGFGSARLLVFCGVALVVPGVVA